MRAREKFSPGEIIAIVVGVIGYGILIFVLDSFVFLRCGIHFDLQSVIERRVPMYLFVGLCTLAYFVIGQVAWFVERIKFRLAASVGISLALVLIVLLVKCGST